MADKMTTCNGIKFSSLFGPADVMWNTTIKGRDELLMEMLKGLATRYPVGSVKEAFDAVIEREEAGCTVLGPGIAMPHARIEGIEELVVGVATSREGLDFCKPGSGKTKVVVLLLAPKANPGLYLQAVCSLAKICSKPDVGERIATLENAEAVWKFFDKGGAVLPEYVCARDIMGPIPLTLKETDTLQVAIDAFVKYGVTTLPVLGPDGNLTGVASVFELLRICVPDYVLWAKELTPIIDFGPFGELLKHESSVLLMDIVTSEFATVEEASPAISAVKEILKQNVMVVYVTKNDKLVGCITLFDFLNKVLRK